MDWLHLMQLLTFGCMILIQTVWSRDMKECIKSGDYLWRKTTPSKFYFCYRIGHAMAMECHENKYMCKISGTAFAPCMCDSKYPGRARYDDCSEQFRVMQNTYRTGGELIPEAGSEQLCKAFCLKIVHCQGFDFHHTMQECRVFWPTEDQSTLEPDQDVNHYIKKPCALKSGYRHRNLTNHVKEVTSPTTGNPNEVEQYGAVEGKEAADPYEKPGKGDDYNAHQGTTPTVLATTTTIPDTGCPYGLKRYEGMSQYGGVELAHAAGSIESCKSWCLHVGYCRGVDYDTVTQQCYYHRTIEEDKMQVNENVMHIRKQKCNPPLKCWSQISYNTTNVDPATPQIPCQGVCFVREKIFNNYSVFERGCHSSQVPDKVGCLVDGSLTGVTCFCDTDRCNGLSIHALAAVMLHLPLDGDLHDHSGLGRDGQTALGYTMPKTSCLEKSLNCSMIFEGNQCIEVPQMASQAWGDVNLENEFTAMFTVSLWFKAMPQETPIIQGLVGNSWDAETDPTWAIETSNVTDCLIRAGLNTDETSSYKPDFPYIWAKCNKWHHMAVTYDSTMDVENHIFPTERVFLDGVEVDGNMHSDIGSILVRRQPVTVGCVKGNTFRGCIDDVRIFAMALEKADIEALRQMSDWLYQ